MSTVELDPLAPEALGVESAAAAAPAAAPKSTIVDMSSGEIIDPDKKTDIAELPPEDRALVVLKSTQTELDLLTLIERTKPLTSIVDKAGRELVHRGAMDHKNARLAIQKASDAATEDAKAFTKAVSKESKRLISLNAEEEARLFTLRDEFDEIERQRKEQEERVERERVEAIKAKIDIFRALPQQSINDDSITLADTLADLRTVEVTFEDFAEFMDEASAVIAEVLEQLDTQLTAARNREAAEAAAAAARELVEKERAAAAEREAALKAQIDALQAQLAANAPKPDAYRISLIDTDGSSLDGWREIGTNADGDYVYESAGMRAIWTGEFSVKEVAHMPAAERLAEFWTEAELAGVAANAQAMADERHGGAAPYDVRDPVGGHAGAGLTALDQPRQQALNEAASNQLDMLAGAREQTAADNVETVRAYEPVGAGYYVEKAEPAQATMADVGLDLAAAQDATVEMVTITREEYDKLLGDAKLLDALYAAGVDNWDGYAAAMANA